MISLTMSEGNYCKPRKRAKNTKTFFKFINHERVRRITSHSSGTQKYTFNSLKDKLPLHSKHIKTQKEYREIHGGRSTSYGV